MSQYITIELPNTQFSVRTTPLHIFIVLLLIPLQKLLPREIWVGIILMLSTLDCKSLALTCSALHSFVSIVAPFRTVIIDKQHKLHLLHLLHSPFVLQATKEVRWIGPDPLPSRWSGGRMRRSEENFETGYIFNDLITLFSNSRATTLHLSYVTLRAEHLDAMYALPNLTSLSLDCITHSAGSRMGHLISSVKTLSIEQAVASEKTREYPPIRPFLAHSITTLIIHNVRRLGGNLATEAILPSLTTVGLIEQKHTLRLSDLPIGFLAAQKTIHTLDLCFKFKFDNTLVPRPAQFLPMLRRLTCLSDWYPVLPRRPLKVYHKYLMYDYYTPGHHQGPFGTVHDDLFVTANRTTLVELCIPILLASLGDTLRMLSELPLLQHLDLFLLRSSSTEASVPPEGTNAELGKMATLEYLSMAFTLSDAQLNTEPLPETCVSIFTEFVLPMCPVAKEIEFKAVTAPIFFGVEEQKWWLRYWKDKDGIWVKRFI